MGELLKKATSNLAFLGALFISVGFMIAERTPAPQSIGVALIFLHPFFNRGVRPALINLVRSPYAYGLAAYYLLILVSAWHGGNMHEYGTLIFMQLPLVLIPFGLYKADMFSARQRNIILGALVGAAVIAGIASFVNYVIHSETINEQIKHSKPISIVTGVNHIYYSIILAFSAAILQWMLFVDRINDRLWRNLAIGGLVIIVFLLHTISARTGLVCFYIEVGVSTIWITARRKKVVPGLFIVAGMALLAFLSIKFAPSIKNRLDNTKVDIHQYTSGENINHYSISQRLEALKIGYGVFKKNPLTGVGPANVQNAMYAEYALEKSQLEQDNRIKPHNQFLYTLVSLGIVGGLVLCFILFMPFVSGHAFKNYLLLMFLVVCLVAFQFEYMLERQVGITFFCLFYGIIGPWATKAPISRENFSQERK